MPRLELPLPILREAATRITGRGAVASPRIDGTHVDYAVRWISQKRDFLTTTTAHGKGWPYDGSGNLAGYFNETETDELSKDGNSYHGNNQTKIYDLTGAMQADVTGTASAKRILP